MKPAYSKPFLEPFAAIELLQARGMEFHDKDFALRCVERIGYYRLSAYWYPFREHERAGTDVRRTDHFIAHTTFEKVMAFYLFDKSLRLSLADPLERIEVAMRALIVDVVGSHGAFAHRDPRSFNATLSRRDPVTGEVPFDNFLAGLDHGFQRSKEEFAKHFRRTYEGPPPIWIAVGAWDWGNIAYVFRYLSDANMQTICTRIDPRLDRRTLISWMASLNEIRNTCAHHARLWNKPLTNMPSFQKAGDLPVFDHIRNLTGAVEQHHASRVYGAALSIAFLMKRLHPQTGWPKRFADLVRKADLPEQIALSSAGFPSRWEAADIWT